MSGFESVLTVNFFLTRYLKQDNVEYALEFSFVCGTQIKIQFRHVRVGSTCGGTTRVQKHIE